MKEIILIINDNADDNNLIKRGLGHAWNLEFVESTTEALKLINKREIQLIMLRVVIGGSSAFDFIVKLLEFENTSEIPLVFITKMEERDEMHQAMKIGGSDYLFKPLDMQEIQMTIRNQMRLKTNGNRN